MGVVVVVVVIVVVVVVAVDGGGGVSLLHFTVFWLFGPNWLTAIILFLMKLAFLLRQSKQQQHHQQ